MRYVAYALLAVLALGALLVAGTVLAVRAWGPSLARERIEAALATALEREARVERVELAPWRGRVVVTGVTVVARPGEPGPNLLRLARAEAYIGVSSLWRRRLVLRSLGLEDMQVMVGGTGGAGLTELPILPVVVAAGPVTIELGPIELRRGGLVYEDPARGVRARATDIGGTVRAGHGATSVSFTASEFTLEASGVRERIGNLAAELRVAPTSVQVRQLAGRWEGHPISVTGRVDGPFDGPTVDLVARGDVELATLGPRLGAGVPLRGLVRVDARIQGPAAAPRVTGSLASDVVVAGPVTARGVAGQVTFADGKVSLASFRAGAFDGSVSGEAVIELAHPERMHVALVLRNAASAALEPLAGLATGATARVDADVDARGDLRDLARARGRVRIAAREVRLPGALARLGAGTIDADATAEGGALDLARGVAGWSGLRLEARGRATREGPAPLRVKVAGDLAQLAPLLGQAQAAGEGALEAEITGRWRDPVLTGSLDVRAPSVAGVRADKATVSFALTRRSLRLAEARVRRGPASVIVTGSLSWPASDRIVVPRTSDVSIALSARTENARIEDAAPWLPAALRGNTGPVAATATIDGTLAAWHASGRVTSSRVVVAPAPPISEIDARVDVTGERIEVSDLKARVLGAPATARGRWRWAGGGEVVADVGSVDLARVPGVPEGLRVEGRARGNVRLTVRDGVTAGSARIAAEDVAVAGVTLGRGVADLASDGSTARGEVTFPEIRAAASGQGPLDGVIAVRATATDVALEPLLRRFRPDLADVVSARLSATASLEIPARDPRAARGTIQLVPSVLVAAGERWEARGPVVIRREPGRLMLERLELTGRLGTGTVTGRLDDNGALDGSVRAQAPLALLAAFQPEIREAAGRLDLDVRVGGTAARPILLGRATLADGVVALRGTGVVVRDIDASATLAPARVRIEELRARVGGGTVRASGEVALDGARIGEYQIALTGRSLTVAPLDGLETAWNAEATLVGRGAKGLVRGQAHLVRGAYTRDLSIVPLLLTSQASGASVEWGRELALQLDLHLDDNMVVRSPQARVRAGGTLRLQGTAARPVVLGAVATQDGRVTFRRNVFTLENAVVRFDDPRRLNPYLDVRATTRIRTYDVTMNLTGRVDDLSIRLSSEPPLPQEDLLALVTLGATRAELGTSGGLTFAGEAARMVSRELLGVETGTPFVDILDFGRSDTGQSEFRIGKRLNDRTTVIYSGSFSEGGQQKLRVEYQVLGPLLLAGEQVFSGGFGGDVILRLRFR